MLVIVIPSTLFFSRHGRLNCRPWIVLRHTYNSLLRRGSVTDRQTSPPPPIRDMIRFALVSPGASPPDLSQ